MCNYYHRDAFVVADVSFGGFELYIAVENDASNLFGKSSHSTHQNIETGSSLPLRI